MPPTVYAFILRHSKKEQLLLLMFAAVSYPFLYVSYDLPKLIINHIKDVVTFSQTTPDGTYAAQTVLGFSFDSHNYLYFLCLVFLVLVLVNGSFKLFINVFKGQLGERMLRRLRYELYSRILRFPLPHFKKVSQGEIIPMITQEVEPLGGFIGDAFVQPIYQGGLLVVPLVFIMVQNPWLGFAAIALYPIQIIVIPKLQRRVNQLAKRRVQAVRRLSDRIGESVSGIQEIHSNDTSTYERAEFADRLGVIFGIRYRIYILKFFTKFLNNSIDKLTPFFFYSIGGYLAFEGRLDIGALVAVIAAQKDLASPWKELLAYYQQKEDVRIKYEQVINQFEPEGMLDPALQPEDAETPPKLDGQVQAAGLSFAEDEATKILDGVTFQLGLDEHVAIVGDAASGKDELAMVMARLVQPTGGTLTVGGTNLSGLPEAFTGRRIGYVGPLTYLFSASMRDNLYYGLKHRVVGEGNTDVEHARERESVMQEAARAGNITRDVTADWIDLESAGVTDADGLRVRAIEIMRLVDMEEDLYQMGLRATVDPRRQPALADSILAARAALRERLAGPELSVLVEPLDKARYNTNATLAENLLFGTAVDARLSDEALSANAYVLAVLEKVGLANEMLEIGRQVAETTVELFSDLAPGHEFFEQFSFIGSDDLPEYQDLVLRVAKEGTAALGAEDRAKLLALPFKLIPARHRLGLIDQAMQARVVEARQVFAADLPEELADAIEFFDAEAYNAAATIQDNILFGRLVYGQAEAETRIGRAIHEVLDSLDLRGSVVEAGLDFPVGIAGSRLTGPQRQKLAIARAVLRQPDVLVVNQATATLDGAAQNRIMKNLQELFKGRGLIWVLQRPSMAEGFDRVLVMKQGRVAEQGAFDELVKSGTTFHELMQAE